jgi:acyl-CoA synthetase (AMP-forming)/AMP-acid ligase II
MSVLRLLERHLAGGADRPLLVAPDGSGQTATASSGDIARDSARFAGWLRAIGAGRGDRVVVDLKNGIDAVVALFGAARIGAIVVGASPQWMPQQLEYVIADSGARVLVTGALRARQLAGRRPPHVLVRGESGTTGDGVTAWSALGEACDDAVAAPDEPALLIYTSGSTGRPKAVVHSHRNLEDFARIVAGYLHNTADDRLLWLLGWSFGYGLSQLLTMCESGGRMIVPASILPADIARAHLDHGATAIAQVPFGWDQLLSFLERTGRQLTGLRYVTNAGDRPSPALIERLRRALPGADIVLMYGQTECFRTTYLPPAQLDAKLGAMGYPIPEVDVRIVGDDGAPCAAGEIGELHHRGALVATGYWNDPEATAARFYVDGDRRVLRTGDLVRRDADGCLWYVGRSDLMIKSAGFRFSPREIEEIALGHPGVREAVAWGIDDRALGQAVEIAVVAGEDLQLAQFLGHLRPLLPRYMLPRRVHVLDALPRSPNGKIRHDALRALSAAAASDELAADPAAGGAASE